MKILVLVLVTLGPLLLGYALGQAQAKKQGLSRDERKEFKAADNLIDEIQAIAAEHSATEPNVTYIIIDTIKQHKRKELT